MMLKTIASADRSRRALAILVAITALLLGSGFSGTTAGSAATFTYDVPTVSRVDVDQVAVAEAGQPQLSDARDESASPSAAARGTFTTSSVSFVATNTAIDTTDALPGYRSFDAAKSDLGPAGPGKVYDHVVEQSQVGRSGFTPEEINSPFNMNPVDSQVNQLKANYYSSKQPFTNGGTVRDWLNGQPFRDQYQFGMDVLRQIQEGLIP